MRRAGEAKCEFSAIFYLKIATEKETYLRRKRSRRERTRKAHDRGLVEFR